MLKYLNTLLAAFLSSYHLFPSSFTVDIFHAKQDGQQSAFESRVAPSDWSDNFKTLEFLERQIKKRKEPKFQHGSDPRALFKEAFSKALMHLISHDHADTIVRFGYPLAKVERFSRQIFNFIDLEDTCRIVKIRSHQQLNMDILVGTIHYYTVVFEFLGMLYHKLGLLPELELLRQQFNKHRPVIEKWIRAIDSNNRREASHNKLENVGNGLASKIDELYSKESAAELARSAFFVANSWDDGKYINHNEHTYFRNIPTKISALRELSHIAREIKQLLHIWSGYNFRQIAKLGAISVVSIRPEDFSVFTELKYCRQQISLLLRKTIKVAHMLSNSLERTKQETDALIAVIGLWGAIDEISTGHWGRLFLSHEMLDLRILNRISDNLKRSAHWPVQTLLDDEKSLLRAEKANNKKKKKKKKNAGHVAKFSLVEEPKHEVATPKDEKLEMASADIQITETPDMAHSEIKDAVAHQRKPTRKKRNRKVKQARINFCEINWNDIEEETVSKLLIDFEVAGKQAFIVGGWVRDRCQGLKMSEYDPTDYDLVIDAEEAELLAWSEKNSIRVHKVSFVDGLYKIGNKIDIMLRPGLNLEQDALSRDFTVNALYYNRSGVVDPLQQGLEDLMSRKLVRVIENDLLPHLFIRSPHEILKAFYLSIRLNLALSDDLKAKIDEHRHRLADSPVNRIFDLLDKLFNLDHGALVDNRVAAWQMLNSFGALDILFPNFTTNMASLNLHDQIKSSFLHREKLLYRFEILAWMLLPGFLNEQHRVDMKTFLEGFFQNMQANDRDIYVQNTEHYLQKIAGALR